MTNVLVTGGAGFVGSNLVDLLIREDYNVKIIDNLSTGNLKNVPEGVKLIRGDITNSEDVKEALKDCEILFHFAAQASVLVSMKEPVHDATVNALGTLELLKESHRIELDQIVFASTGGAIYGEPNSLPVSEAHPENPISFYGTSKLAAEKYVKFYQSQGLKSSILRFANIYGPRQDPFGEAGVISIFLNLIKQNKPIIVFGDGSSTRDYIYVEDVARATINITKNPSPDPLNVGSGQQTTLNELIDTMKMVVGKDFEIKYGPERAGDVYQIYLDSKAINDYLAWKPSINLKDGLKKVWDWVNLN